ncbi:MAG: hypothetical protein JST46_04320 [Bacteroidetes bacterium]|nr:hypothetical protein [Bacteroidota bacterium]
MELAPPNGGDDITISYTPGPILQSNEYYTFGMQTARSWTRPAVTPNNFLANGGTEYNAFSSMYDLDFRNYDPILGRLTQVDPLSAKYAEMSPYHFAFNNPATFNDPGGADAECFVCSQAAYTAGMPWSHDYITGRPANSEGYQAWNPGFYGPAMSASQAVGALLSSANGGSWSANTGLVMYNRDEESFASGYAYNEYHNSWENTSPKDSYAALGFYETAKALGSTDLRYALAALEGPGPRSKPIDPMKELIEPTNDDPNAGQNKSNNVFGETGQGTKYWRKDLEEMKTIDENPKYPWNQNSYSLLKSIGWNVYEGTSYLIDRMLYYGIPSKNTPIHPWGYYKTTHRAYFFEKENLTVIP